MPAKQALIVDDNRGNLDVLSMLLTQQGLAVTSAQSIKQASAALENDRADIVFLDLEFPIGSGFEMLQDITLTPCTSAKSTWRAAPVSTGFWASRSTRAASQSNSAA
ncbi:MAG: response regulator [Anaerolineae bacterium]|nr:response regulator [Anaerolineae bacterium]